MPRIEKTDKLSQFVRVIGNRDINPIHVARLVESIKAHNMLEYSPIIVNSKYQVIDGQTRLEAAKKLGVSIYYVMSDTLTLDDVMLLNVHLKPWTMTDYLKSYVERAIPAYIRVQEFMKKWGLSLANSLAILATEPEEHLRAPYVEFKTGQLETPGEDYADEFAAAMHAVKPYTIGNVWQNREFMLALKDLFYKHGVKVVDLIERLEVWGKPLGWEGNVTDYLRQLEDVWNKGLHNKVKFA